MLPNGPGHAVVGSPAHSFVNKVSDCRASNQPACRSFSHCAGRQASIGWNLKIAATD